MANNDKTYVLDVKYNDENEIFKLSFQTKWDDISLMLLLKYDCNVENYWFSYTDNDNNDEIKRLQNQNDFEDALQVCSNNYNVLYMQIWSSDVLLSQLNKNYCYNTNGELKQSQGSNSKNGQYLYVAGEAIKQTLKSATGVVKTATNAVKREIDRQISQSAAENSDVVQKPSTSSAVDKGDHSEIKNTNSTHRTNDYQSDEVTSTVKDDQPDIFNNSDGQPLEKELNATKITKSLQSSSAYCQEQLIKVIKEEVRLAVKEEMKSMKDDIKQLLANHNQLTSSISESEQFQKLRKEIKSLTQSMVSSVVQHNNESPSIMNRIMKVGVLCENLPSPANIVSVSSSFEKCWVLKNTGTRNWCTGIVLKMIHEDPDTRFSSQEEETGGLWKKVVEIQPLKVGGIQAISIQHQAPSYNCTYSTIWSLCIGADLFGPLLRCKVEVGGELITSDLADDNISITGSSPNTEASHFTLCDQIDDCEQSLTPVASRETAENTSSFKLTSVPISSHNIVSSNNASNKSSWVQPFQKTSDENEVGNLVNKTPENNSQDLEEKSKTEEKTTDDDISSNSDYEVLPNPSNFDDLISQQEIEVENVLSEKNPVSLSSGKLHSVASFVEPASGELKTNSAESQHSLMTSQQLHSQVSSCSLVDADFSATNLAQVCDEVGGTDHFESFAVLSMPQSTMTSLVPPPSSVANQFEIFAPPPTLTSIASQPSAPINITSFQPSKNDTEEKVKNIQKIPTQSTSIGESRRSFSADLNGQNAEPPKLFPDNLSSQTKSNSSEVRSNASDHNDLINKKLQKDDVLKTVKTPKSILKKPGTSKAVADEKPTTSRKKLQKIPSRPSHGSQVSKAYSGASVVAKKNITTTDSPKEKYPVQMRQLVEMGFNKTKLNRSLLEEFDGNLNGVVNALVTHLATTDDGQFHA